MALRGFDVIVRWAGGLTVAVCFAAPLGAIAWQLAAHPSAWAELGHDAYRLRLLAVTVGYNLLVAGVATALALPAAVALGRGRGLATRLLWVAMPVSLLLPTITFEYGWKEAFRQAGALPVAQSVGDVLRCVWTLGCWLWPIPAAAGALALRRADASVFEQAALDGASGRITLRLLAAPLLAASGAVFVLASQEYAVYEPTGIRVVATEVRLVFETGAVSTAVEPMARTQADRVAAAMVTAAPLAGLTMAIAGMLSLGARWWASDAGVGATAGGAPSRVMRAPAWAVASAYGVATVATAIPIAALIRSHSRAINLSDVVTTFWPLLAGSAGLATGGMVVACVLVAVGLRVPSVWTLRTGVACFLVGGQMLALAMIWLLNRPGLGWAYDSPLAAVLTYVARFGWIALLPAAATWQRSWRLLRELAMTDGASPAQTTARVVLPAAWPMLLAGVLLVGVLCLTEVPATMLIGPLRPRPLVPMLMTWIHIQDYDPMIEGTLLLSLSAAATAAFIVLLMWLATRLRRGGVVAARWAVVLASLVLPLTGCDDGERPRAIWLETGMGPGQVVYPRAIDYRREDGSFVVIDRMARVQRIDADGRFINAWRMPDHELGKPVGVTVGPDGNIYVPDTHYQRVIVYAPDGRELRRWGRQGKGPGEFIYPTDVALDARGRVFVSEYGGNDRIQVFDSEGRYLYEFGQFGQGDGEFSRPQSIAIVGEQVYVTDSCNHRLVVFDTEGRWQRNLGGVGTSPGQFRFPYGLAVDGRGMLVVCEFGNNRVQKIDPSTGRSVGLWGRAGRGAGELAYPWAVAVDSSGDVAVLDAGNNRIQVARF